MDFFSALFAISAVKMFSEWAGEIASNVDAEADEVFVFVNSESELSALCIPGKKDAG